MYFRLVAAPQAKPRTLAPGPPWPGGAADRLQSLAALRRQPRRAARGCAIGEAPRRGSINRDFICTFADIYIYIHIHTYIHIFIYIVDVHVSLSLPIIYIHTLCIETLVSRIASAGLYADLYQESDSASHT